MRALLLRKGKKEVDRREGREEEGDLPDQCQTASYAPDSTATTGTCSNNKLQ